MVIYYIKQKIKIMKNFKKIAVQFLIVMILSFVVIEFTSFARELLPLSEGSETVYTGEGQLPGPDVGESGDKKSGQDILIDLVLGGLRYVKALLVVIGILYITIMGYILVTKGDNEEEVTKAKRGITYASEQRRSTARMLCSWVRCTGSENSRKRNFGARLLWRWIVRMRLRLDSTGPGGNR